MKPLISVIIPIYNVKSYIKEAVDSIIKQKEFLHEIILVNDGSTDGSGDYIENLYGQFNFVKIIHKNNEGQGVARNWGTKKSTGNFIYYFDADDILINGLFKKFHQILIKNADLDIYCFSGKSFLDPNFTFEKVKNKDRLSHGAQIRKIENICISGEEAFNLLNNNDSYYVYTWLYIFRKEILTNAQIEFKPIKNEDGEFINHLFLFAGKTIISNDVYVMHRIRAGSTMQVERTFKDIYGFMESTVSLHHLSKLVHIQISTKEILKTKIENSIKALIQTIASNRIEMNKHEKALYDEFIKKYIFPKIKLLAYYFRYPIEYKLRKLKKKTQLVISIIITHKNFK